MKDRTIKSSSKKSCDRTSFTADAQAKSASLPKAKDFDGEMSRMLCSLLRLQSAPNVDIQTFRGDPLEYNFFMSSFREAVERKIDDPHGRLVLLLKFTDGKAKETIGHCIQHPSEIRYRLVKLLLEDHYGHPHRILAAYRKEIKSWIPLKPENSTAYRKFYNFLIKCDSIMSCQQWNSLDTPDILCSLVSKPPGNTRDRWNRKIFMLRKHQQLEPDLSDLIDFIEEEMVLANGPLFSRDASKDYADKHDGSSKKRLMKSYAAQAPVPAKEETENTNQSNCQICGGRHDMDNCTVFNKQPVDERSTTLGKRNLCYGCYMPITADHNVRNCSNRRVCKICNQKHPTSLHGYVQKRRDGSNIATTSSANPIENDNLGGSSLPVVNNFAEMDLKCTSAGIPAKIISMCVISVKIGHVGTKKEVSTLDMLDNCSQGTFMKESIKRKLGISGRKTEITIKTLNGKQNMESTMVTGLKVSKNVHGERIRWLNLPATYPREALPADAEEVATEEKSRKWEHLKIIADKLLTETNMKI